MDAAVLVFDGVTAVEAAGPFGVYRRVPDSRVRFVGRAAGPVATQGAKQPLIAEVAIAEVERPEVVVVPGGLGVERLLGDEEVVAWVRSCHPTALWTTSVSTGSAVLAAAGILNGLDATTHWLATALIEQHGAKAVAERLVRAGRVITTVGAVSAIEGALLVVGRAAGFGMADRVRAALSRDLDDAIGAQLAGVDPPPTWRAQTAPVSIDAYVDAEPVGRPARTGRRPSRWSRFASRGIRVENDR